MATMWRRAMMYLGLGPDDEYDEYDEYDYDAPAEPRGHAAPRYVPEQAPPDPQMPAVSTVRPMPREPEREREPEPSALRPRGAVVRPIVTQPSPKPHAISPVSFNEAQEVADKFMAGVPVIVNLQGVERELSRRLVDFASGLCYGLRGQMERVTNQIYLLTPSDVEVSDEDRRRLQERNS
ncbi:MAG: cell division protein SepF [Acidimicrobiia bacterium]|nr:cell division protein SepF [Acidimicrobiia bacterium]